MKKYIFDIHYDMVIRDIEIVAENDQEAAQLAKDKAARLPLESMECVGQDACISEREELTAEELRSKEREAVTDFVRKYIGWCCDDISTAKDKDTRRAFKRKLGRIAYDGRPIAWTYAIGNVPTDHPLREWLKALYTSLADKSNPRTALYNRYARLVARHEFERRYKNTAKSLFAACDLRDAGKMQKKQAVVDGCEMLCDKMDEYVMNQDEPDFKGWEPQMVIRYDFGTDRHGHDDYWNLFVYCHGPNDGEDASDCYELATAWQHQHYTADGHDDCDDYSTEIHDSRADLLRYLFYALPPEFDETDEQPTAEEMTDVWVD